MTTPVMNQDQDLLRDDPDAIHTALKCGPIEILVVLKHSQIKYAADVVDGMLKSSASLDPSLKSQMLEVVFKPLVYIPNAAFDYSHSKLVYSSQANVWFVRLEGVMLSDDDEPFTADFALDIKSLM